LLLPLKLVQKIATTGMNDVTSVNKTGYNDVTKVATGAEQTVSNVVSPLSTGVGSAVGSVGRAFKAWQQIQGRDSDRSAPVLVVLLVL